MHSVGKNGKVALSFRHTGIVVRDMDKALGFYRDLLGLETVTECIEEGPFIERLTSVPGAKIRIVKLQVQAGELQKSGLIELLQFLSPPIPGHDELAKTHISHVAFSVNHVDSLFEEWTKKGVRFNHPPQISPDGFAKVAYCHDPDGTVVELVELSNP